MEENALISDLEDRQKELTLSLVNGVADFEAYIALVNRIRGLEEAKSIIHDAYIRQNHGDGESEDEFGE